MARCGCSKIFSSFLGWRRNHLSWRRGAWRTSLYCLSTGELECRRQKEEGCPPSVRSLVATLPAVLAALSGSLGRKYDGNLPDSERVASFWTYGEFRPEEINARGKSDREVLAPRHANTVKSHKDQQKQGIQVKRVCYDRCAPAGGGRPSWEEREPRMRKGQATEPVRASSFRVVISEAGGRFCSSCQPRSSSTQGGDIWGSRISYRRRVPACGAAGANTRHARLCHRAGAQVEPNQPLVHAASRFLRLMSVRNQADSVSPFNGDGDVRMNIAIERGGLRDASAFFFRHKIIIDILRGPPSRGSAACRKC